MNFAWEVPGGEYSVDGTLSAVRPVQGVLPDCHFIAALSSYVWVKSLRAALPREEGGLQYYTYYFYEYPRARPRVVEVSNMIWLCDHCYYGARSVDPGEYWPAVYEKAYAAFRDGTGTDTPDMGVLDTTGNPVTALVHMTGRQSFVYRNATMSASAAFSRIQQLTLANKTTMPMVAWTYASDVASAAADPPGVHYADDAIVANHSYSILGIHVPSADEAYVVLRNPFGIGTGEPSAGVAAGVWPVRTPWGENEIPLDLEDGIFALEKDLFHAYFEAFGNVALL